MQTLVNNVRAAGSKNVIIVQTLGVRKVGTTQDHLISDPLGRLAYAIHPRPFTWENNSDQYGLAIGGAFSTTTNKAIFDAAFGNAAKQVPVIADEWDIRQFTGPAISCAEVPQVAYFEAAYLQKYTAGVVGWALDLVPYTIARDWQYTPHGYSDSSLCAGAHSTLTNIGDVGDLLYSWYHGTDLWRS